MKACGVLNPLDIAELRGHREAVVGYYRPAIEAFWAYLVECDGDRLAQLGPVAQYIERDAKERIEQAVIRVLERIEQPQQSPVLVMALALTLALWEPRVSDTVRELWRLYKSENDAMAEAVDWCVTHYAQFPSTPLAVRMWVRRHIYRLDQMPVVDQLTYGPT
jgi:hypothetical protein